MYQTTCNVLRLSKEQYKVVDTLSFLSKNMYNYGLYMSRQYYFNNETLLKFRECREICKDNENYSQLPNDAAQNTLQVVERSMKSFISLKKKQDRGYYQAKVNLPHYLPKNGRFALIFPKAHLSCRNGSVLLPTSTAFRKEHNLKRGEFRIPIPAHINPNQLIELRILPVHGGKFYKSEWVYEVKEEPSLNQDNWMSIDLGINNFATCVDNVVGTPIIYDGKYLKSLNRYYNKEISKYQSIKDKQGIRTVTNKITKLWLKRSRQINDFMNKTVHSIIEHCKTHDIGHLVIGEIKGIKQESNLGRQNNQVICQTPWGKFKSKLESKCKIAGITFHLVDESYTSQTDALALDPIQKPETNGRKYRGCFISKTGNMINADVNGALNILRKVSGDSPVKEIISSGRVFRPVSCQMIKSGLIQIKL